MERLESSGDEKLKILPELFFHCERLIQNAATFSFTSLYSVYQLLWYRSGSLSHGQRLGILIVPTGINEMKSASLGFRTKKSGQNLLRGSDLNIMKKSVFECKTLQWVSVGFKG